jgi:hypothetical protein
MVLYETISNNFNYNFGKKNIDKQFQTSFNIYYSILYKYQLPNQNNCQIDEQIKTIQVFSGQSKTISIQFF